MLKKLLSLGAVLVSAVLASCGGGGDGTISGSGGGGGAEVGSVTVLTSSPQLQSGQASTVTITAQVKDSNNAVLKDITVQFNASSGSLAVTQAVTDSMGMAVAQLSAGTNLANRAITVTALAGTASGSVVVNVVGTTLSITGPDALAQSDTGAYVAAAKDSTGAGISGATLTLTSANGNTIAAANLTTDVSGTVPFNVTATAAGNDTLTVSGLGLTGTKAVAISGDAFAFTTPGAGAEINLVAGPQPVTVRWAKSGVPQAGETINFSTTRGTLSARTAVTNGSGEATVTIFSTTSGSAVLTATNDEATTTNRSIEFIATSAATVDLQASRATIGVGEKSDLSAVVRDADDNLVKNKIVEFQIIGGSGGTLSPGTAVTDSQGLAKSAYTAGGATGAGGVQIRATVQDTPLVNDTVALTVAGQAYFITLGTGNTLFEPDTAQYAKEWSISVTDVQGRPVSGQTIQASVRSTGYLKGQLLWADPAWSNAASRLYCPDEDTDKNGQLDLVNEDVNNNGRMEAGNIARVVAVPSTASASAPCAALNASGGAADVVTNTQGNARVCVFYAQSYAEWVEVKLTATAPVGGSEFSASSVFTLQVLADDVGDETIGPPNQFSPFGVQIPTGTQADCTIAPP